MSMSTGTLLGSMLALAIGLLAVLKITGDRATEAVEEIRSTEETDREN